MFVQVIQGQVSEPAAVREALNQWQRDLSSGASGWLGSTAGVTDDGEFVAVVRFESEEAARRNSDRPEQGQWWAETSKLFTGEVTFRESSEIDLDLHGDPDTAGFVQVIQGRTSDPKQARELMMQNPDEWAAFRPDIIASVGVDHGDGSYTAVLYFTSEEQAREGEGKEAPPKLKEQMDAMMALEVGQPSFLDIRDPWLQAPA